MLVSTTVFCDLETCFPNLHVRLVTSSICDLGQRLQSNSCAIGALRTLSVCDEFDIYCLAIVSEIVVTTVTIEARLWCDLP